jgi:dihydroorotate dehydrogenase electron transfer subunit
MSREMEMVRVQEVRKEAERIFTVTFKADLKDLIPGQFLMIWIPGVDEIPMSVSINNDGVFGITAQNIGDATESICNLKEGDMIGIRGPFGNGFTLPSKRKIKNIIGISGGVGGASTILPVEWAFEKGYNVFNIVGSRSKENLLFRERWERCCGQITFTTDDGSFGMKGFVTDALKELLEKMETADRKKTMVFSCGPEIMMMAVKEVLEQYDMEAQFSLERYMKCGIGLCDSCSVSGKRVCMDGPVFDLDQISQMKEFGQFHRDRSGKLIPLKECVR